MIIIYKKETKKKKYVVDQNYSDFVTYFLDGLIQYNSKVY